MTLFEILIPGKPRTQGSMQLSRDPRTGHEFAKYALDTVQHRNYVVERLRTAWARPALTGPVELALRFYFPRPKNHLRTNGELKDWAPAWCASGGDLDKLARLVCDAGTIAGLYEDDRQVALIRAEKRYGYPGTHVRLSDLSEARGDVSGVCRL